jgi:hypothetical protein
MIRSNNPWENMGESSKRRVDINIKYNFFWVLDIGGRYGFCIQSDEIFTNKDETISLKGISIIRRNESSSYGNLFLILNNNEDWQIFLAICEDLISTAKKSVDNKHIIIAVEDRLKRWQQLLKIDNYKGFTIEKQMGLFTELICLKNIIAPEYGFRQAITSWVGPDFDKQDFLTDNAVIEVKSYRSSKGEIVQISSLQQLQSPNKPLYLIANGITNSESGLSVKDIADSIRDLINSDEEIVELFDIKLSEYGYIPEIMQKQQLYKFIIDCQKIYHITELFPKILRCDIKSQITQVKYSIDLSQCKEYEVTFNILFKEGSIL